MQALYLFYKPFTLSSVHCYFLSKLFQLIVFPQLLLYVFLTCGFITQIFFEQQITLFYIIFQKVVSFDQLDQKRMQFNMRERKLKRGKKIFYIALGILECAWFISINVFCDYLLEIALGFSAITFMVFSCFQLLSFFSSASLLMAMRLFQNYEFKRHFVRLTLMTVVFQLVYIAVLFGICTMCSGMLAVIFDKYFHIRDGKSWLSYFVDFTK